MRQLTDDNLLRLWKTGGDIHLHQAEEDSDTDVSIIMSPHGQ